MDWLLVTRVLLLVGVANSAPLFASLWMKRRLDRPVDGGLQFLDGRHLFGASKTVRGVVASILCTTLAAPLVGFDWEIGALISLGAITGDLAASFTKRRLGLKVHAQAFGLDQIPESLLPLLLLQSQLDLTVLEIAAAVFAFVVLEAILSILLYRLHIRDRPY